MIFGLLSKMSAVLPQHFALTEYSCCRCSAVSVVLDAVAPASVCVARVLQTIAAAAAAAAGAHAASTIHNIWWLPNERSSDAAFCA